MKFLFWNVVFILMVYPVFAGDYFVLGGGEGVAEIIAPRQIEEGPDGNIYIYDEGAVFIKVFSKEGAYLRQMGGKGPGPGEILRAGNLHFNFTPDGKRLYFSEFFEGHRWLTFMNLSGSYSDVLKLKMTKVYGILATLPLRDGFLAQVSFSGEVERKREYYLYNEVAALVKLTPEGRISPPILEQKYVGGISRLPDGGEVRIPFKPKFLWVYLDGQIILSDGVSPVLQRYDMSGKLLGEIKTFLPAPQPVMAADLDEWKKNKKRQIKNKNWFNRFGSIIYKYDI
ncbi:MAG: hypothetical protein GY757_28750, partial [bacterium]|nr:hypothetical protein [bacterium]